MRICRGIMVMLFSGLHQGIMTRTIGVKVVGVIVGGDVEITTEQSDSVRISYVLRDDERDTLRIRLEYSEDGEGWKVSCVFGDTVIVSSWYSGFITWVSRVDLPGVDLAGLVGNYYFKVECSDVDIGVSETIVLQT